MPGNLSLRSKLEITYIPKFGLSPQTCLLLFIPYKYMTFIKLSIGITTVKPIKCSCQNPTNCQNEINCCAHKLTRHQMPYANFHLPSSQRVHQILRKVRLPVTGKQIPTQIDCIANLCFFVVFPVCRCGGVIRIL